MRPGGQRSHVCTSRHCCCCCRPYYNPWDGGGREYSYGMQPNAAAGNLVCLANALAALLLAPAAEGGMGGHMEGSPQGEGEGEGTGGPTASSLSEAKERESVVGALRASVDGFGETFQALHSANCRAKLGLAAWDEDAQAIWDELLTLMSSQSAQAPSGSGLMRGAAPAGGVDFTLLFRTLSSHELLAEASLKDVDASVRALLEPAALDSIDGWPEEHLGAWREWAHRYWRRMVSEARPTKDVLDEMRAANPKYVLRNWMAAEGYEAAIKGDYSVVRELQEVLRRPYEDQSEEAEAKWAKRTPGWARGKMGLASMS